MHVACLQEPAIAAEVEPEWAVSGASGACAGPEVGIATTGEEVPTDPGAPVMAHPNAATKGLEPTGCTEPAAIAGAADAAWRVEARGSVLSAVDVAKAQAHPGGLQIGAASVGAKQWCA